MLNVDGIGAVQTESRGGNYTAEKSAARLIKSLSYTAQARETFSPAPEQDNPKCLSYILYVF
jgi:hypothetical protein